MESGKLVVSELLAFLQHQLEIMDETSVTQICVANFSEDEIRGARAQLYESLHLTEFALPRRRGNLAERCLQDIITILRDTDRKFLPIFVAKELRKLPPVTFDHVYVTRLLKDITTLKTSQAAMNFKLESSQRIINDLHNEVIDLRSNTKVCESSEESSQDLSYEVVNSLHINDQLELPKPTPPAKPTWAEQCEPIRTNGISTKDNTSISHPVTYKQTVSNNGKIQDSNKTESQPINNISQTPEPEMQTVTKKKRSRKNKKSTSQSEPSGQPDPEGFVKVEKKKKAPIERSQRPIKITEPPPPSIRYVPLYVVRLSLKTTVEHVIEYLRLKTTWILNVDKLESKNNTTFNTFRIWVPSQHVSRFLKENYWPKGCICRRGRQQNGGTVEELWDKSVPPPVLNVLDNKL
ncbi:unnamed protein product [Chrysodeixis includens]|uniref:Uncharacterized protein n=1 Tax=Chrysodeixis includens TaxID=689277 RepID=A0A9P0FPP8_CHRIL|nr:unnamed protein product [Chrysodeixis includens]